MRIIEVTEYNAEWNVRFEKESVVLRDIFGNNLRQIHHIGSTSVPGLWAKPTIDILVTVRDLNEVDKINKKIEDLGYKVHGEYGITGRRFFSKIRYINEKDWVTSFHVHVFREDDTNNIERHIAVREYLKTHPERAFEYGELKKRIAQKYPHDGSGYTEAKADFVKELEKDALEWYRNHK